MNTRSKHGSLACAYIQPAVVHASLSDMRSICAAKYESCFYPSDLRNNPKDEVLQISMSSPFLSKQPTVAALLLPCLPFSWIAMMLDH